MMVRRALWLAARSASSGHAPDPTAGSERVKRCAARRPLLAVPMAWCRTFGPYEDLSRARAHRARRTAPAASVAQHLDRPSHQALRATTGDRDRAPHCRMAHRYAWRRSGRVRRATESSIRVHRATQRDLPCASAPLLVDTRESCAGAPHGDAAACMYLIGDGL